MSTAPMQPSWSGTIPSGKEVLLAQLHALFVGAIQTMEHAGRTVYDCTNEVPWTCLLDMARQVWDASRQVETFLQLAQHVGDKCGTLPADPVVSAATGVDADVTHGLCGLRADVLVQLMHTAKQRRDAVLARAVDHVLADHMAHIQMRQYWLHTLTDVESLHKAFAWYGEADARLDDALQSGLCERETEPHAIA